MRRLVARDALDAGVRRVTAESRPPPAGSTEHAGAYAVFAEPARGAKPGPFVGIVTARQIAAHPGRIFADIPSQAGEPVAPNCPLDTVRERMDTQGLQAVAVLEPAGRFVGAVTRASVLAALLAQERRLLAESRDLQASLAQEHDRLTRLSERLRGLQASSVELLSLVVSQPLEGDLIRKGLAILRTVVEADAAALLLPGEAGAPGEAFAAGMDDAEAARLASRLAPAPADATGARFHRRRAQRTQPPPPGSTADRPRHAGPVLGLPVGACHGLDGAVYVLRKPGGRDFSDEERRLVAAYADALALAVAFTRTSREHERLYRALRDAATATAAVGARFFDDLVGALGRTLGGESCFIGEFVEGAELRIIAIGAAGQHLAGRAFPIAGTPYEAVSQGYPSYRRNGIGRDFPADALSAALGADACLAYPLVAGDGRVLGMLAVVCRRPLSDRGSTASLLQIYAARAAGDLERKKAEGALRESEQQFRDLTENIRAVFWLYDQVLDRVLYVSPAYEEVWGRRREHLYAEPQSWLDAVHPQDRGRVVEALRGRASIGAYDVQYRVIRPDGSVRYIHDRAFPIRASDGAVRRVGGLAEDVTGRVQAEAEMRKLSSAVAQSADPVVITDRAGLIEYVNPAFERLTGFSAAEAVGKTPRIVKSGRHDPAFYRGLWDTILRGEVFRATLMNHKKNGELYYLEDTITPLRDADGEIAFFVSTGRDVTEQFLAQHELRRTHRFLDSVVENIPNMVFVKDAQDLRFVSINRAGEALLGMDRSLVVGRTDRDLLPAEEADFFLETDRTVLGERRLVDIPEEAIHTRNNGVRILHTKKIPVADEQGEPLYLLGISEDITEQKRSSGLIARLGAILDGSVNEIYVFGADTLRFIQVNQGAQRNLGYAAEELAAFTPLDLMPGMSKERFERALAPLRRGEQEAVSFETTHRRKDGSTYPVELRLQIPRRETPPVFVVIALDITERKRSEERLVYLANYDTLTGLPNRVLMTDRLRQALIDAGRHGRLVAVMFLDLDRFKTINDTLGHAAGDALLKAVAQRLTATVRPGDTVCRVGGDEFVLLLTDIAQAGDVGPLAQKLLDAFVPPFDVAGREFFVAASIGTALYPLDGQDIEDLVRAADMAMYHAKDHGRNNYKFYSAALDAKAHERLALENELRHALERDEFVLYYQPQIDLGEGRIICMESLIRWRHPGRGLVLPGQFVPVAEDAGLIVPMGEWALRTACAQAKRWQEMGLPPVRIAVNLSARHLDQPDLPKRLRQILEDTGLDAHYLEVEVTESATMRNADRAILVLQGLKAIGVSVALDDFGIGYSSLNYLKRFPIDTIKIDQSFVRNIITDANDAAIASAIIAMAHSLDIEVVGEGVETPEQLAFLLARSCDAIQGYYFSPALPADEATTLLRSWQDK